MSTLESDARQTPSAVARNARGRATVMLADGRRVELDAFRDACRDSAQALRRQAIADSADALAAAWRRLLGALSARIGRTLSAKAGVRVRRA